ncbi:hypothetical protein [Actinotalea sp. C106]|uniref:hypothetical protein n=1 Tax=Actinotalea sp. C106 TaxID=2908644 RepID=UPI00202871F1|nr:hypothetical protein [Actinotalea sp. C106]
MAPQRSQDWTFAFDDGARGLDGAPAGAALTDEQGLLIDLLRVELRLVEELALGGADVDLRATRELVTRLVRGGASLESIADAVPCRLSFLAGLGIGD